MLKPVRILGSVNETSPLFTHDLNATPFQALEAARQMHELLLDGPALTSLDRRSLARQISGQLFAVEADHILPAVSRAFFVRLRTDAYHRAALIDSARLCDHDRVSVGYDEIENGLRLSM